jgi:sigma-B regulation protein RsbU (phosphoserine phosphatase)
MDDYIKQLEQENKVLKERLKSYEKYESENKLMRSEHVVAEQIQRSMLPTNYPAFSEFPQIDLYADMDAAGEVGGDFYDYFKIDDSHICFGIYDIEGKGIPAAIYMAVTKTMLKLRLQTGEDIETVFESINKQLCTSAMQKKFITSWTAVMDVENGKMRVINAGHNYPILLKKDGSIEFINNKSGLPLASYYSKKFKSSYKSFELDLNDGDVLILYTDGVTEAQNRADSQFGDARLIEAIKCYMADDHSMKDLTAYLRRQVISFMNHAGQDDDITLLAVKYCGK